LLDDPKLFDRITIEELEKTVAGEEKARRAIFLSLCSIWVEGAPIHTLVNSESSAGKSYICSRIRDLFPTERYSWRTRISPTTLTYWHNSKFEPEWTWDGKFFYLEDVSENVMNSDVFKVMCSEGSVATVVYKQRAIDVIINGKPAMLLTTASSLPNNEILNRFNVVSLDESEEQTNRVKVRHAKNAVFSEKTDHDGVRAMLGLLNRVNVCIPYAEKILGYFPSEVRARRDYPRFLSLVRSSAALHQVQRKKEETGFVVAEAQDYEIAREAIQYITTSIPIGLTRRQAMAFQIAKDFYDLRKLESVDKKDEELEGTTFSFSAREIWAHKPIVNEQSWLKLLDTLAQRGHLEVQLADSERKGGRPKSVYSPLDTHTLKLPTFEDL